MAPEAPSQTAFGARQGSIRNLTDGGGHLRRIGQLASAAFVAAMRSVSPHEPEAVFEVLLKRKEFQLTWLPEALRDGLSAAKRSGMELGSAPVCIVGQLRSAARLEVVSGLRQVWDGVGAGCADVYLNLGAEPVDAAHHHAEEAAPSEEALAQAIRVMRPVDSIISRHPLPEGSEAAECARPTDFNSSSVLCEVPPFGRESAAGWPSCFADLGGRQCTHCAASRYRLAASRIAQCGPMI